MAKTIKMCDMPLEIAVAVFQMLNPDNVKIEPVTRLNSRIAIVTDIEPKDLIYPEGWYYAKGAFRNKHMSTTGFYQEARMVTTEGNVWKDIANYCTCD